MHAKLSSRESYRFDRFILDLQTEALLPPDGTEIRLRRKSFELIRLLVEHAERLLTRDEIMQALWPGVFVTDDSITQCIGEIRRALGREGKDLLRTIHGRGYLLAAEVRRAETVGEARCLAPSTLPSIRRAVPACSPRRREVLKLRTTAGPWSDEASLRLADGLGELLVVELGRLGHAVAPAEAGGPGTEKAPSLLLLEVRVERRSRRSVAAIARLRALGTGVVHWAESFSFREGTFLSPTRGAQARIAAAVGSPVYGQLAEVRNALSRALPAEELSPAELCVRASGAIALGDAASLAEGRALLERALALDPDSVPARIVLTYGELSLATLSLLDPAAAAERALAHATAALRLRPTAAMASCCLGAAAGQLGEGRTAERALAEAVSQSPNDTTILNFAAWEHVMHGRPDQASRLLARAAALDPAASLRFPVNYGLLAYAEGRYGDALALLRRGPAKWRHLTFYYGLAAAGQLGRPDVAERIGRSTQSCDAPPAPEILYRSVGGASPRGLDHLMEGLLKAGVPSA